MYLYMLNIQEWSAEVGTLDAVPLATRAIAVISTYLYSKDVRVDLLDSNLQH